MLVGQSTIQKRRGFVADFCPMCREMLTVRLIEFRRAPHINGIAIGFVLGRSTGFVTECTKCGFRIKTRLERFESVEKRRPESLDELEQRTNPRARNDFGTRLETERRIRHGAPLPPEKRQAFLREPFRLVRNEIDTDQGIYLRRDQTSLWIAVSSFVGPIPFVAVASNIENQTVAESLAILGFTVFVIGLATTLFRISTRRYRFFRVKLLPMIDRALRPLAPSMTELEETIDWLRETDFKFANRLRASDFRDRLQLLELAPRELG